jgi:outer membrane protein TolC
MRSRAREGGRRRARTGRLGPALVALAALAGGCRPATKEAADREVAGILASRARCVPAAGPIDLTASECDAQAARAAALAPAPRVIVLSEALELATLASRDVRNEREEVYLAALALSDARHEFAPIPFAGGTVDFVVTDEGSNVSAAPTVGFAKALETGGSIAVSVLGELLKSLTGTPLRTSQSLLALDVLLPLARGSGRLVARENLTQAERDVVYALRSYVRFQQEFTVRVATAFYRVLEARDTWNNEQRSFESLTRLEERARANAQAGNISNFQVAQARQDTLRADDRRQRAESDYRSALDDLRLLLGLPPTAAIEPSDADLEALIARGARRATLAEAEALTRARERRLDLANAREQVEDARRKAEVARDAMGVQVDLSLGADLTTPSTQPLDLSEASRAFAAGLFVDLPLDRLPERNAFRAALIQAVRAWRALEGLEDGIDRQIRADLRRLEETARSQEIQAEGVRLAERRVEGTTLEFEGPRANVTIRDVLEAEDDLVQARNALTSAVVDHQIAWLQLELDLGTLRVDGAPEGDPACPPCPPPPRPPPPPCPAPWPPASGHHPPPPAATSPAEAK